MTKLQKLRKYLTSPRAVAIWLVNRGALNWMPDRPYLYLVYLLNMRRPLHLKHPVTFNEKLQWLKLYNRRPEYTVMVDKVKAKEYVAGIIGEEHIIPTLGVWDDPDDIDFDALPDKFVLKCNHNSGLGMCICRDKSKLNIPEVKRQLRRGLRQNYYLHGREWPYRDVPRKILAEKFMQDTCQPLRGGQLLDNQPNDKAARCESDGCELKDYKFFCFDGEPKFLYISDSQRHKSVFLHTDWTPAGICRDDYTPLENVPPKPDNLDEMLDAARRLSKGIPHVRVDFYNIGRHMYFGELTLFTCSGTIPFRPAEWDSRIGELLKLPEKAENAK